MATLHEQWMQSALIEASKAYDANEVPVGAIIVLEEKIIGRGYNQIENLKDPTAHAEMIAITAASHHLQSKVLDKCTLYVTLEPCTMCAGAIVLSKISNLVFGAYDLKTGACGTLYNITEDKRLNHTVHVIGGVCDRESEFLLKQFFNSKRHKLK